MLMVWLDVVNQDVAVLFIHLSLTVLLLTAVLAWVFRAHETRVVRCGVAGCLAGSGLGLVAVGTLFWPAGALPVQTGYFMLNALSAFFLLPVYGLGAVSAWYAAGYMRGRYRGQSGIFWMFYALTLLGMSGVCLLDSPLHFLVAWEVMGISSFFLVAFESRGRENLSAYWSYLLACFGGAAALILMFALGLRPDAQDHLGLIVTCGFVGFGLKAAFPLLHHWLPAAHQVAPAPLSALTSAMMNLGFFGILRWLGPMSERMPVQDAWFGWAFLGIGLVAAVYGALLSLAQKQLKGLLAYSSLENMGIIAVALGLSYLGAAAGEPAVAGLARCGALLHILNHSILKGGLFMIAGNVLRGSGTLEMDRLGGLLKRLPLSGTLFILLAAALSGLPPFNAFAGEFLIYLAGFKGSVADGMPLRLAALVSVLVLALAGGMTLTAYCKAAGSVFLGEPRSEAARSAALPGAGLNGPVLLTAYLALAMLTLAPLLLIRASRHVIPGETFMLTALPWGMTAASFLYALALLGGVLLCLLSLLLLHYWREMRRRPPELQGTWDCGYAEPTARMEYNGTAFVQPQLKFFAGLLGTRLRVGRLEGAYPVEVEGSLRTSDPGERWLWRPLLSWLCRGTKLAHRLQSGYLHVYLLLMLLTLAGMLVWAFAG